MSMYYAAATGPYSPFMGPSIGGPQMGYGGHVGGGHFYGHQQQWQYQLDNAKELVTVYVPNSVVGAIIGRGGSTIKEMMANSGATIKVSECGQKWFWIQFLFHFRWLNKTKKLSLQVVIRRQHRRPVRCHPRPIVAVRPPR